MTERRLGVRAAGERGTALAFASAAFLIFLVLAAIASDLTAAFLAHRQLQAAADGAANDAVTVAFDRERFIATGEYGLDAEAVRRSVAAAVADDTSPLVRGARIAVVGPVDTGDPSRPVRIEVRLDAEAPTVFARAVPGGPRSFAVHARAVATVVLQG